MISSSDLVIGQPALVVPRDIIATVLDVAATAWREVVARREVNAESTEPQIAGCLGRAMKLEKDRRNIGNLRIEEEVGTRSTLDQAKPDGRIDVKIIYSFEEREYFGIECKRVTTGDRTLAGKYVNEGIMRIVSGKYSTGLDYASMMGFIMKGNCADCTQFLAAHICDCSTQTCMEGAWRAEDRFGAHPHLYSTEHRQQGLSTTITILHLFLALQ